MANELTSAGITFKYAVETTAGTKPTSGFTAIPNVKSIGEVNNEPSTLDVTDLSDTVWKRSIPSLRDTGGAIAIGANFTAAFKTAWASMVSAAATAKASSKATWYQVDVPNFGTFSFAGYPTPLGLPGIEVDSVFEGEAYVTPNQIDGWATT